MNPEEIKKEKLNTIAGILRVKEVLQKQKVDLEHKIDDIDKTLRHLWEVFDLCPHCWGKGENFSRACAEDEGEMKSCDTCNGTGKFIAKKFELPQHARYLTSR